MRDEIRSMLKKAGKRLAKGKETDRQTETESQTDRERDNKSVGEGRH